ncbi:MAG TPA: amidohydrolase family protein [Myxococcales bacterium]|nr:amidohydrolase family protein [Myxococcales bacterium]
MPWLLLALAIDAHAHLEPADLAAGVRAAQAQKDAARIFLLTPPDTFDHPGRLDEEALLAAVGPPGKLAVIAGGSTLNAMIQEDSRDAAAFRARAEQLLKAGAIGFGEITVEHFAGGTPYQSAPPDHPLMLLLAGIAGGSGAPIVLHMEALRGNLAAFERLLDHDKRARIVWAHAGADGTGLRTPDLCRRLLKAHANLFMELKIDPRNPGLNPLLDGERLRPAWLELFQQFPDRFIIGSDQHYAGDGRRWQAMLGMLAQLPAELQRKIGGENALRLYSRLEAK